MSKAATINEKRYPVATVSELPVGATKIVSVPLSRGRTMELGIFNVHGRLVAYRNVCPHAAAPVCLGRICGTTLPSKVGEYILARQGEILRCPWHGWEFDLLTGEHLVDEKMRLRSYPLETVGDAEAGANENLEAVTVGVEQEQIYVVLP